MHLSRLLQLQQAAILLKMKIFCRQTLAVFQMKDGTQPVVQTVKVTAVVFEKRRINMAAKRPDTLVASP